MSGFFSLAGATEIGKVQDQDQDQQQQENDIISPYSLYLFKNDEIYSKRFELWQQYYQLHQHQYDHHKRSSDHNNSNEMRQGVYGVAGGSGSGGGSGGISGGINCQDCGNQAKKDCQHMRCRTCCKARGFHCQTHVKSTWVPAAKRREHQQQLMSLATHQQQQHNSSGNNQQLSLMMRATTTTSGDDHQHPKRLREDHHHHESQPRIAGAGAGSGVMLSTTQHHTTSSGLQVGHFPAEVSSPAVFRCVRVSAMNESEEEQLAYQTSLNVGGHVFKGILYDHGPDEGSSSSRGGGGGSQQLNLITHSGGTTAASTSMNPGVSFVDQSSSAAYPTPFSAFMAGTQFFPPPRS